MEILGLEKISGMEFLQNFSLEGSANSIIGVVITILVFGFIAGIVGIFLYRIKNKKLYNKTIHWFEEVNGRMVSIGHDQACELFIPHTNISVFYIKEKNMYLPRPTIRMGRDAYWYCIKNNKEIVNIEMTNLNKDKKKGEIDYDHTDMRYGHTQLRDLIKRNYRDKSKPWWKEFKETITLVVIVFIATLSIIFILSRVDELLSKIGGLMEISKQIVASSCSAGSGVVPT